ncbi:MAG: hypothetical protein ACI4XR_02455 [Bacilli bacterium]
MLNIPAPCKNEVKKYLDKWVSLENYVLQENSLDKLFFKTYPNNDNINDILIKASSLNDFYSTNIFSIFSVAKHIHSLNIDERLKKHDESLVNDIANLEISGKKITFYSFITKYCSYFNKKDNFSKFTKKDLKYYAKFKTVLIDFKKYYGIDEYNL